MKIIILSFIVSIAIHFLLFKNYQIKEENKNNTKIEEKKKKSTVTYVKIKKQVEKKELPKTQTKKTPVKKDVVKPKPKPKVKPKTNPKPKTKTVKKKTYVQKKKVKKTVKKPIKSTLQNKILKEQIVNKKDSIQQKTLEGFLSQKDPVDKKILSQLQRLYGREYETFTKVQKAYLEKNINNFQVVTQRVLNRLGYPQLAARLKLSGNNVVEFMFYPNGNIKNLRITTSSGYEVFDKYTLELIEIAYKDYPRPKTLTKLKFRVYYRLY